MPYVQYSPAPVGLIGAVAAEKDGVLHVLYDPDVSLQERFIAFANIFRADEFGQAIFTTGEFVQRALGV